MIPAMVSPVELRRLGFEALVRELGWVNAVRFLNEYEIGQGDYVQERRDMLPSWDVETLTDKALRR